MLIHNTLVGLDLRQHIRIGAAGKVITAFDIARTILDGFDKHYRLFRATSARARERFETGAWTEQQHAVQERIRFYDERVRECVDRLRGECDVGALSDETWSDA